MVYETLRSILAQQLDVEEDSIGPDTNIVDDLGADSLDIVELITSLEDEFNILITDHSVKDLFTVREISEYIENLIK
ncbi:MAG: acyl carrier protein [Oscillospiraceae bacterium]